MSLMIFYSLFSPGLATSAAGKLALWLYRNREAQDAYPMRFIC